MPVLTMTLLAQAARLLISEVGAEYKQKGTPLRLWWNLDYSAML